MTQIISKYNQQTSLYYCFIVFSSQFSTILMYYTWYTNYYFLSYCICKMTNWLNSTSEKHLEKFLSWKHFVTNTTFFMNFQKLKKHYHSVASLPDWHTVDLGSIPNSGMKKKRPPVAYRGLCFWYVLLVSTQKVKRCVFKN